MANYKVTLVNIRGGATHKSYVFVPPEAEPAQAIRAHLLKYNMLMQFENWKVRGFRRC